MSLVGSLVAYGLRQVIGVPADQVVSVIEQRFADHSQALPKALAHAHERAWQSLAIALAGDGFLDQVRIFFSSGDDRGIREQVRLFLENSPLPLDKTASQFRGLCLDELKRLRKSGRLSSSALPVAQVAREAATFQRYTEPQG
jgi:hypothetical protein